MNNVKHLVAGFVLGLIVAIAPSCGTAKNCGPSTCNAGCCDAKGDCQLGTSNGACGQLGGTCAVCAIAQACNLGTCSQTNGNGGGAQSGGGTGGGTTGGGTGGGTTGGGGGTTGGGTGGGTTGGGGGTTGGGTGGGAGCDGCIYMGTMCLNIGNSGTAVACGQGGVACATCSGATPNCVNYSCSGGTGGGTGGGTTGGGGGTTGGGGGTLQPIGGPCTSSPNCQAGLTCRITTARGDGTYPGGYCSKACTVQTDCGGTNDCLGGSDSNLQFFGETTGFCAAGCPSAQSQSTCRPGYRCEWAASGTPGWCWLDPLPPFSGGGQATNSGNPCTVDTCQPSNVNMYLGFCFKATLPDGGFSGWTGGTCSADCGLDNTGTFCGSTATCVGLTAGNVCLRTCTGPGTRSTCRNPGYSCFSLSSADGGVSSTSICYPDCTVTGCSTGTCNTTSGQCQ